MGLTHSGRSRVAGETPLGEAERSSRGLSRLQLGLPFRTMSKAEILAALPNLTAAEREEVRR